MENINIIRGLIHYDLDFENYEKNNSDERKFTGIFRIIK